MKPVLMMTAGLLSVAALVLIFSPTAADNPVTAQAFLARFDADGNGTVSEAEYQHTSDGLVAFDIFDLDDNSVLTDWEVEQMLLRISPDTPQPALLPRVR